MTHLIKVACLSIAMIVANVLASPIAQAGDPQIDAAVSEGLIGERIDGYLGAVASDVEPTLMRKMNDINNQRRALYAQLAEQTNTTTAQVARITGEKQIAKAPPGTHVMTENGGWTRK
ncbi:MAG: YdbL family protein [Pseudomonadota bacterium]